MVNYGKMRNDENCNQNFYILPYVRNKLFLQLQYTFKHYKCFGIIFIKLALSSSGNEINFFPEPISLIDKAFKIENPVCNNTKCLVTL